MNIKVNADKNPSGQAVESPLAALEWNVVMDRRPAPVFLAALSGIALYLGLSHPSTKTFLMLSVIFGIYAIQITVWRAALMIMDAIQRNSASSGELARNA